MAVRIPVSPSPELGRQDLINIVENRLSALLLEVITHIADNTRATSTHTCCASAMDPSLAPASHAIPTPTPTYPPATPVAELE